MGRDKIDKEFAKYIVQNGYIQGVILNILVYGAIYKIFGFEWAVVVGIAHINSDIDWTNILLFKNKKAN